MEINSSSILTFPISDNNAEYYMLVGIRELTYDRTEFTFICAPTRPGKVIVVPIKKGEKTQDIIKALRQKLIDELPVTANIAAIFNEKVMPDIEAQISNKLDKIHTTYFEEQISLNPLVKHAMTVVKRNGDRKVTDSDIEFIFVVIGKEIPKEELVTMSLFYGIKTTFINKKLHTEVNSPEAGHGKTFIQQKNLEYEDQRYVFTYSEITEKAIYHQDGVNVIQDPDTGDLIELDPIIAEMLAEFHEIEANIDNAKSDLSTATKEEKVTIKKIIKQFEIDKRKIERNIEDLEAKAEKLIILTHKIFNIPDTPKVGMLHTMMSVLSQDTESDQVFMFTDKDKKGHQKTRNVRIRGTPVIIYSQVIIDNKDTRQAETSRRFVKLIPRTDKEKINAATTNQWIRGGRTDEEIDDDIVARADVQQAKEISALISAKLILHSTKFGHKKSGLRVPFVTTLQLNAQKKPVAWQMTVQDRADKYLSIITLCAMDSRPKLINRSTGQAYVFSTFKDLQKMFYLMKNGALGVRPYLAMWFNEGFQKIYSKIGHDFKWKLNPDGKNTTSKVFETNNGIYPSDLKDITRELFGVTMSPKRITEKLINPLSDYGIIDKIPSSIDKRYSVLQPVDKDELLTSDFAESVGTEA